ncbi:MAG: hypothetical protein K8R21_10335, partial [Leptospira sp.]|nr:hypothetical protein [Leptospira sp.]
MNKYYSIILCISLANCFRFEKGKFIPSSLLFLSGSGKFTISGTINNLNTSGMVLKSGTGQTLNISSGAKTFTFPNSEASGTNYSVALSSPPAGQSCTVKNGTGTISSNVSNVQLDCYTSGSFDTSFGNGLGYIETANPAGVANSFDVARGMAIVSGDKIVFSGSTGNDIFACRLNADGSLDTSFIGTGPIPGCSIFDSTFPDVGYAMNVDQNGKIYAAGLNQLPGPFNYVLAVGFNSSGSLDTNFNSTGYVSYKIGAPGSGPDEARAIVPDSSGKIIMSGRSQCTGGGACNWTLWRYNT